MNNAAQDVLAERERQKAVEGWTPEHDDEHADGSLAIVAACYAAPMAKHTKSDIADVSGGRGETPVWAMRKFKVPKLWPASWHASWWKPKDYRSNLVRAGALILAEIERIDRAEQRKEKTNVCV